MAERCHCAKKAKPELYLSPALAPTVPPWAGNTAASQPVATLVPLMDQFAHQASKELGGCLFWDEVTHPIRGHR